METKAATYEVTLRFKYPAWDEKDGIKFEIVSRSKADAIKQARRQAYDDGHTVGRPITEYSFRAEVK